jgi:hypothetical protein
MLIKLFIEFNDSETKSSNLKNIILSNKTKVDKICSVTLCVQIFIFTLYW